MAQESSAAPNGVAADSVDVRESILAEWESEESADEATPEEPAKEEAPDDAESEDEPDAEEDEEESDSDDEEEDEESSDDDDEEEESDEDDEAEEEDEQEAADPVASKRIARIQAEERRAKQAIAEERQQLLQERRQLEGLRADVEEFKSLRERARFDPLSTLIKLGLGDEDLEPAARAIYAASPEGRKDPKLRDAAAQMQRVRGTSAELEQANKKISDLEARINEREQREAQQRQVEQYTQRVTSAINGKTPIVSALLKNHPEMARARLLDTARALTESTGEVPDPAAVVAAFEKERIAELKAMGIEPPTPVRKKKNGKKKNTNTAAETKKATTTEAKETTNNPPNADLDEFALREQIINEDWDEG